MPHTNSRIGFQISIEGNESATLSGEDVTIYRKNPPLCWERDAAEDHPIHKCGRRVAIGGVPADPETFRYSGPLTLQIPSKLHKSRLTKENTDLYEGRALACLCYRRQYASITARLEDSIQLPPPAGPGATSPLRGSLRSNFLKDKDPTSEHPIPFAMVIEYLWALIGVNRPSGAILITGATGSGKTQIANGLIHKVVEAELASKVVRRPHVVTAEDPIEALMFQSPADALAAGVDYTPREMNRDVPSVEAALEDALRQKPCVVYLGELRADQDLARMTAFARTGHLVVATAHAGTLVEAMDKLFNVNKASNPSQRGQVAGALLAAIHLRPWQFQDDTGSWLACLPAVWRRTPTGIAELVSDGLSSLLPNAPAPNIPFEPPQCSSLGRRFFVHTLLHPLLSDSPFGYRRVRDVLGGRESALFQLALEWDLDGL